MLCYDTLFNLDNTLKHNIEPRSWSKEVPMKLVFQPNDEHIKILRLSDFLKPNILPDLRGCDRVVPQRALEQRDSTQTWSIFVY